MTKNLFSFYSTKFLAILLFFVSAFGMGQTTVDYTFSSTSGTIDSNISFTTQQNSGSVAPAFNSNLRLYFDTSGSGNGCSITLTPSNGVTITKVVLNAASGYTPTVNYKVNGGSDATATLSGTAYTISGISATSSLKIRNANTTTNTQLRLTSISVTYTASATSYIVTFDSNGGTGTMSNQTASTATNLSANTFARSGYSFAGWNTASDGTGTSYADNVSYDFSADMTLYAQWSSGSTSTCINESFETGLTTSYQTGTVNLNSGSWNVTNVMKGTTGVKTGSASAQLQSATSSQITTPTLTNAQNIDFWATGSTSSGAFQVRVSTDDGVNFTSLGTYTPGTSTVHYSVPISTPGVNKIMIYRTGATLYIEDVVVTCGPAPENPVLSITGTADNGSTCLGSAASSVTYTVTNSGQNSASGVAVTSSDTQFAVGALSSTTIAGNGGTATFNVTFTPTTAGAKPANLTAHSTTSGATDGTYSITGTGTASVTQAITTNTVTTYSNTTATLRAASITQGVCPASTEQGFVYSVNSVNGTPTVGGTGVSKVTVTLGNTTYSATGLAEGTTYAVQAYIYNGTTYTYGGVKTFQTTVAAPNVPTTVKPCLVDNSGTISWAAPTSGSTPTGYMVFAIAGATAPTGTVTTANADYSYANSNFGASGNTATPSTLGKLIYKGIGLSTPITGLTEDQNYSFKVYSYREGAEIRAFASGTSSEATDYKAQDDVKTFAGTPSNGQVTLNWTYNGATSCFDEVMIVANQGTVSFTPTGDGSTYTADSVYSSANQVVYKGTATSKAITGLTNGLQYCFTIWVRRGTTWSDGTSVCVTPDVAYCDATGDSSNVSGILNVTFNAINNTTLSSNGYEDYTSQITNVQLGSSYDLSVKVNTNGSYTSYVKAWIDWNHDGTFDNSSTGNEAYELGTITNSTNGTPSASPKSITVPTGAYIGNVRMRIAANTQNSIGNYSTPCESFTYGEVEDYTISVVHSLDPEVYVKGGGINIPNGFDAPYGLNNTLFASTNLGSQTSAKDFVIGNSGINNLVLSGTPIIQLTGDNPGDFVVSQQAASPIEGSSTSTFSIYFKPTVSGTRTAIVKILNNDSDEGDFEFMIQGTGVCAATYTGTITPATGPVGTTVNINSATDLTGATVYLGSILLTSTVIDAHNVSVVITDNTNSSLLSVILSNGCSFVNTFTLISNDITSCESYTTSIGAPGDLFISEVTDSPTGSLTYVEIYNGTGSTVDFSTTPYTIKIFNNGSTTVDSNNVLTISSGTLANGDNAVLAMGAPIDSSAPQCAVTGGDGSLTESFIGINTTSGGINFKSDGSDFIGLYKNSTLVDVFGVYGDKTWANNILANNATAGADFRRKKTASSLPNTTFSLTDWTQYNWGDCSAVDYSDIGSTYDFSSSVKALPIVVTQPVFVPNCDHVVLSVTGAEGITGGLGLAYQWFYNAPGTSIWTAVTDGANYSGATSNFLTINSASGLNNYQYYCQVRENSATCYKASNAVQIKDLETSWNGTWSNGTPTLTSKVIINADYNTTTNGNFDACSLTLNSGKLEITQDHYVNVQYHVINNNTQENFVVNSDGNLVQKSDTYNNGNPVLNSGNITVYRNAKMKRLDYNYWGAPVSGQNLRNFSSKTLLNRFYVYNETNDYFDGIFVKNTYPITTLYPTLTYSLTPLENPTSYNFVAGKGYAVRAENTASSVPTIFPGVFYGQPNNGSISVHINKSADTAIDGVTYSHGYDLVSNPYPSNIDLDLFFSDNLLLDKIAYFWTNINPNPAMQGSQYPKTGYINNYAIYSPTGGLAAPSASCNADNSECSKIPNNILKVGQGFIVKAKSSGEILFKNHIREPDNTGIFFNRLSNKKDRFWLELKTPLDFVNPILVGYLDGATDGLDDDYDARLMINGADSFYSILGDERLAVQGKKYPVKENDVISLGATFYETGLHSISLSKKDGVFANGKPIYLHDKLLKVYTNLQNESYSFNASQGDDDSRFEIVYKTDSTLSANEETEQSVRVYFDKENLIVEANNIFDKVLVYDISGKLISSITAGKRKVMIEKSKLYSGVNLISIIFADKIVNKKVISK